MMKVKANKDMCAGHACCNVKCPEVFGLDEFGYIELLMEDVPDHLKEKVRAGALHCPENVIQVIDI